MSASNRRLESERAHRRAHSPADGRALTVSITETPQRFFLVTPPAVHQMIVTLERNGLISRIPGQPRSIQLLVPAENLPTLQPIKTSAARYWRVAAQRMV